MIYTERSAQLAGVDGFQNPFNCPATTWRKAIDHQPPFECPFVGSDGRN